MTKLLTKETLMKIEDELMADEYLHIDSDTDISYDVEYLKTYLVTIYVMKDSGSERAKFNAFMSHNMYANWMNGEENY